MKKSKLLLSVSFLCALGLSLPDSKTALALCAAAGIAVLLWVWKKPEMPAWSVKYPLAWGIVLFALARFWGLCLTDPLRFLMPRWMGRAYPLVPLAVAPVLALGSLPAICLVTGSVVDRFSRETLPAGNPNPTVSQKEAAGLLLLAAVSMALLSKSSPLYPFNDWVDANCFVTVGKSVMNGKILYRDIYEQKGPCIYFLYGAAYILSHRSFFGAWLLEIGAAFCVLYYLLKSLRIYCRGQGDWMVMVAAAFFIYGSDYFYHGGSCEEFCLPALMYCGYLGLRFLHGGKLPSFREGVFLGIGAGFVLWTKFNLLGFYVGWILVPGWLLLRRGDGKSLLCLIGSIALGVVLITLPILGYFVYHGALMDLLISYFYNNIFVYKTVSSRPGIFHMAKGVLLCVKDWVYFPVLLWGGIAAWILVLRKNRAEGMHLLFTAAIAFVAVFLSSPVYDYYVFILNASIFWFLLGFAVLAARWKVTPRNAAAAVLACLLLFWNSPNRYLIGKPKETLPQVRLAKVMEQSENPTLLNYGFLDCGLYTLTDILPTTRFFCTLHVGLPEMDEEMNRCIQNGDVEFVVTRNMELEADNYRLVAQESGYFEQQFFDYYLYQRAD